MQPVERKTAEELTVKEYLGRATDWVRNFWTTNAYYEGETTYVTDEYGDEEEHVAASEGGALHPSKFDTLNGVCSVGAMRVAFADLIQMPYDGEDHLGPYWFESTIMEHPLYQEGMKILGQAFYEAEQQWAAEHERHILTVEDDREKLLDGLDGRPYTVQDVEAQVITINDAGMTEQDWFIVAFERATELAPDTPLALS